NPWWRDVLKHGQASMYADYFDIEWSPEKDELRGKILLPILGDQYGAALERGEIRLGFERGELWVRCGSRVLPTDPQRASMVLSHGLEELKRELEGEESLAEYLSVMTQLDNL